MLENRRMPVAEVATSEACCAALLPAGHQDSAEHPLGPPAGNLAVRCRVLELLRCFLSKRAATVLTEAFQE